MKKLGKSLLLQLCSLLEGVVVKEKLIVYLFCSFSSCNHKTIQYRKLLSQSKLTLLSMGNICHGGFKL